MGSTRLQGAKYESQNARKRRTGDVQQAGMRPDAVVLIHRIEFIEPHHSDRATYSLFSLAGDLWDAIGGVEFEASGQHFFAISTAAATEFKNASSWREKPKKCVQVSACAARSAGYVHWRRIGVKAKRRLIAGGVIGRCGPKRFHARRLRFDCSLGR